MEFVQNFLECSTIHGLTYISTTRKYVRLFWIIVVISGFSAAGFLIRTSFKAWDESPVKTTIEIRRITNLTFPKITVCPPKNTYTDLNYDLMMTQNLTLDDDNRNDLSVYALELLYDHMYNTIMTNLSKLEEKDRYYNWYHGYTYIEQPYFLSNCDKDEKFCYVVYRVATSSLSGTVWTQYFGDAFFADKVETFIQYEVKVYSPENVEYDENVTLHFHLDKISLNGLSTNEEKFSNSELGVLPPDKIIRKAYSPPKYARSILLTRKVSPVDVRNQKLNLMPGFNLTWYYSGFDKNNVTSVRYSMFYEHDISAFVRKSFILIVSFDYCKEISLV